MRLSRIQKNFEALAAQDPLWTVLSDDSKRDGKWDPEEFYRTGETEIVDLEKRLAQFGVQVRGESALDFGCGVGRLSFPLSRRFDLCVGIDISASMIAHANRNVGRGASCRFIVNTEPHLRCLDGSAFDFAYSDIVFQHMPPRHARRYYREIARLLKPNGCFVFQLPSHLNLATSDNQKPLRLLRKRLHYWTKSLAQSFGIGSPYFEMNATRSDRLIRYLEKRVGLRLVALWDHPAAGVNWHSYLYVFRK